MSCCHDTLKYWEDVDNDDDDDDYDDTMMHAYQAFDMHYMDSLMR